MCLKLHTFLCFFHILQEDPFDAESHPLPDIVSETSLEFFQSDPFVGSKYTLLSKCTFAEMCFV